MQAMTTILRTDPLSVLLTNITKLLDSHPFLVPEVKLLSSFASSVMVQSTVPCFAENDSVIGQDTSMCLFSPDWTEGIEGWRTWCRSIYKYSDDVLQMPIPYQGVNQSLTGRE